MVIPCALRLSVMQMSLHILLVSSKSTDAERVRFALGEETSFAFALTVVASATEAVELARCHHFSTVLFVSDLPAEAVGEAVLYLKSRLKQSSVVVVADMDEASFHFALIQRLAQGYLRKSTFHGEELVRTIKKAQHFQYPLTPRLICLCSFIHSSKTAATPS